MFGLLSRSQLTNVVRAPARGEAGPMQCCQIPPGELFSLHVPVNRALEKERRDAADRAHPECAIHLPERSGRITLIF